MSLLKIQNIDDIGTLTLNHSAKRNVLSGALLDELIAALRRLEEQACRVVVIRAPKGTTVWSAGHDVRELPLSGRDPLAWSDPLPSAIRAVEDFSQPVIAMIEGRVFTSPLMLSWL